MQPEEIKDENWQDSGKRYVLVCQHTSCTEAGSPALLAAFSAAELPDDVEVIATGCQGQCSVAPTVRIVPEEIWYYRVQLTDVSIIVEEHLKGGQPVQAKLNPRIHMRFF